MLKRTFIGFIYILFACNIYANDSFSCGLADTVGFSGKAINAVTNFYFSAPTYHSAVTSGTSGCSGLAYSDELKVEYIAKNYDLLKLFSWFIGFSVAIIFLWKAYKEYWKKQ